MELHQIRYFVALSRSLNFTRAAERCNITQPALIKAIQRLEGELGGELIYRERQFTKLTELGKLVLPRLEEILSAADDARRSAEDFRKRKETPLKIGLSTSVSAALLGAIAPKIVALHPTLQISTSLRLRYSDAAWHGLLLVSRTRPNARNAEESMPCALSTKIEPDSRGSSPAMTAAHHRVACADTASHFPFCFAQQSV